MDFFRKCNRHNWAKITEESISTIEMKKTGGKEHDGYKPNVYISYYMDMIRSDHIV